MRLTVMSLALTLGLPATVASAIPAPPPPPLKNMEILGQVLQEGKPVSGTTVQAHFYNCETKIQAKTITNQAGYYRLVIPSYPRKVLVSRPLPSTHQTPLTSSPP